ncbi:MAG: MFS transporter [Desulfobulbaceae bacterium]|nr:MFS transporter [Desulfobulbaceae bacterium]
MNKRILGFLSAGHLVNDLHQGAIPALLPFLILQHNLSYSAAGTIVLAFTGTATIIQPLFGFLADRFSKNWFIPAGIMLTSIGFALTGLASNYFFLIVAVIISGIGSAVFHPEAARMVNFASGDRQATAMSIFGVGGVLGFSVGPFIITQVVLNFGTKGVMITLVPTAMVAILFLINSTKLNPVKHTVSPKQQQDDYDRGKDDWFAFILLSLTIIGKSIIYYGLFTFIPLYWSNVLQQSEMAGGTALTIFSTAGIFGNLLGGRLADRYGHTRVIAIGCTLLIPSLPALLWADNVLIATIMLAVVGMLLLSTYGPTIVLGQKYLPNHIGFSSGMTLGVAFSIGGMVAPLLGRLADQQGLSSALASLVFIPIIISIMSYKLPSSDKGISRG